MKIFTFFLLCLSLCIPSHAEDLDTVWTKQYIGLTCVKFSPDGKRILGAYGNSILELDATTGDTLRKYEERGVNSLIPYMQITNDGIFVYTGTSSCEMYGWNTTTGKSLGRINYDKELNRTCGFCIHPTENKMYFFFKDTIALFNLTKNTFEKINIIKDKFITNFAVSKDNKLIAISSSYYDNSKKIYLQKIFLINTNDFSVIEEIKESINETLGLDFSYDSKYLAFLSTENGSHVVNIYDINQKTTNRYYYGHFNSTPISIKFTSDRNLLFVSGGDLGKRGNTSVVDNSMKKVLYTINYGGWQGCIDVNSANQIVIEDNYTLALINSRWFTTSVPPDPRVKMNGNMKITYMNEVLSLDNADSELIKLISVFDINGKLVKTYDAGYSGATVELPFSAPAGVYLVRILTDQSDYNFRFVRE